MLNNILHVEKVQTRGKKFAIVSGKITLARFYTPEEAQAELDKNRSLYEYWSGSVSVCVDNSEKKIVNP